MFYINALALRASKIDIKLPVPAFLYQSSLAFIDIKNQKNSFLYQNAPHA